MPRRKTDVKNKHVKPRGSRTQSKLKEKEIHALGAVDLHFHGAFGIDLMTADSAQMDLLSKLMWENGIAAFCPTTLSAPAAVLAEAVGRIGNWIQSKSAPGAVPLGIHLEGPFIDSGACGAHPRDTIRKLNFLELENLWKASQNTLKILTVAPEILTKSELNQLVKWTSERKISLSLGHSKATEIQASVAFDAGFRGVTHAWNALPFHHRAPGPLGAALGRKDVYLELILDQVHVSQSVIRLSRKLHSASQTCFISDCVPAAATRVGSQHSFGPLTIQFKDGACRLPDGSLAGGGRLLPEAFGRWLSTEAEQTGRKASEILRESLESLTTAPLRAIGVSPQVLIKRKIRWKLDKLGNLKVFSN